LFLQLHAMVDMLVLPTMLTLVCEPSPLMNFMLNS